MVCGLDIGTSKIAGCLCLGARGQQKPALFFSSAEARGIKKGVVNDAALFCESVDKVLGGLQKDSGARFREVHVSLQGDFSCRHSNAAVTLSERGNRQITSQDIRKINEQARMLGVRLDESLLYSFPVYYVIDDDVRSAKPAGLYARKFEVDLYLVTAPASLTDNIALAINNAGYNVAGFYLSSAALGHSALTAEEQDKGVLLIDMGAEITEAAVFKDGGVRHLEIFGFGADDFTRALKDELKIGIELAEEIKESYGTLFVEQLDDKQEIMINRHGSYVPVKRSEICCALVKKSGPILKAMENRLRYIINKEELPCGIVAAGGGSYLEGLLEAMEKVFHVSVKIAAIRQDLTQKKELKYATALGIIKMVLESREQKESSLPTPEGLFRRLSEKLKEVYQEYF